MRQIELGYGRSLLSLCFDEKRFAILASKAPDEDVRRMRMTQARTLAEALANIDASVEGYVLPRGAALLPVTRD